MNCALGLSDPQAKSEHLCVCVCTKTLFKTQYKRFSVLEMINDRFNVKELPSYRLDNISLVINCLFFHLHKSFANTQIIHVLNADLSFAPVSFAIY